MRSFWTMLVITTARSNQTIKQDPLDISLSNPLPWAWASEYFFWVPLCERGLFCEWGCAGCGSLFLCGRVIITSSTGISNLQFVKCYLSADQLWVIPHSQLALISVAWFWSVIWFQFWAKFGLNLLFAWRHFVLPPWHCRVVGRKPQCCANTAQQLLTYCCVINATLVTNPKYSKIQTAMNKINSIPAGFNISALVLYHLSPKIMRKEML